MTSTGDCALDRKKYLLKLHGLPLAAGQIRATDVVIAIDSLIRTARGTTLLIATGTSRTNSSKYPSWIVSATDLMVVGVGRGSTTLEISAPLLLDAAHDHFKYKDLWAPDVEIRENDTSLDLVMDAIEEAKEDGSCGDRYDHEILKSISLLGNIGGKGGGAVTLLSFGSGGRNFSLGPEEFDRFKQLGKALPSPSKHVISGKLDRLQHSERFFQIDVGNSKKVSVTWAGEILDRETLEPMWGSKMTVIGKVSFKANGDVRRVEAHGLRRFEDGDELFQQLPKPRYHPNYRKHVLSQLRVREKLDPLGLANRWPGDEPIEGLLKQLEEL